MKKRPKILITNDDGIHSAGIKQLWTALKDIGDVTVTAPANEQSAVGLGITLRSPLHMQRIDWGDDSSIWSVNGTPADCVKMALSVVMDGAPDLVVSGINRGSNAGRNVMYSGTVAGTIEAVMHDIPGIAFSCCDYKNPNFKLAAKHIHHFIEYIMEHPLPKGTLLNVNFPDHGDEIKGFKMTRQGKEFWGEDPNERFHPIEGHRYYWLGCKLEQFDEHEDSDIVWLKKGYATAVPIHVGELTDNVHFNEKRDHFESWFVKS